MKKIFTLFVLYLLSFGVESVRVCKTFEDYNIPFNPNCYNNPDGERNITETINSWGFTVEEHYVTTEDGYILLVIRAYKHIIRPTPIVIAHGILMNGQAFVLKGKDSLVYILGKLGYDVWIINFRGTKYSLRHTHLSHYKYAYWDYSLDQVGKYDIKAVVDRVYWETRRKVILVGYSMGSKTALIYGTTFPDEAREKLKGLVALGPTVYYINSTTIFNLQIPFVRFIRALDMYVFKGTFYSLMSRVMPACAKTRKSMVLCDFVNSLAFGADYELADPLYTPVFFKQLADTIASKIFEHMLQIKVTERFQHYDYGRKTNLKVYGQVIPPLYRLENFPVPVSPWVGLNDAIATLPSAIKLHSQLRPEIACKINVISHQKWNHLDFLEARDIENLLYHDLLRVIEGLENEYCDT